MSTIFWILAAFLSGSLPFSVWVGRLALRTDIRRYGDNNPGATNVLRAGGKTAAGLALLLDILKGALPVGMAWFFGELAGWPLVLVSLAPVLGHAYSPFLGFNGGKAVAVTGGVWAGLTGGVAIFGLALLLVVWYLLIKPDGWVVLATSLSLLLLLFLFSASATLLAVWAGSTLILAWKYRADLTRRPTLAPRLRQRATP